MYSSTVRGSVTHFLLSSSFYHEPEGLLPSIFPSIFLNIMSPKVYCPLPFLLSSSLPRARRSSTLYLSFYIPHSTTETTPETTVIPLATLARHAFPPFPSHYVTLLFSIPPPSLSLPHTHTNLQYH